MGIGRNIYVEPGHRLDLRIDPGYRFGSLGAQLLRGDLSRTHQIGELDGILFVPFLPAHHPAVRVRHWRIPPGRPADAGCWPPARSPPPYLIAAKASTCTSRSGLANCRTGTVALFGEGGPK